MPTLYAIIFVLSYIAAALISGGEIVNFEIWVIGLLSMIYGKIEENNKDK